MKISELNKEYKSQYIKNSATYKILTDGRFFKTRGGDLELKYVYKQLVILRISFL